VSLRLALDSPSFLAAPPKLELGSPRDHEGGHEPEGIALLERWQCISASARFLPLAADDQWEDIGFNRKLKPSAGGRAQQNVEQERSRQADSRDGWTDKMPPQPP
jgi:hypothetical protein